MTDLDITTGLIMLVVGFIALCHWFAGKLERSIGARTRKADPVYVYPLPKAVALPLPEWTIQCPGCSAKMSPLSNSRIRVVADRPRAVCIKCAGLA